MPARSLLLGAAAALLLVPSLAHANVDTVTLSQNGDAVVDQPNAATFTANAFSQGTGVSGATFYYFTTDCTDPSDPAQYAGSVAQVASTYNPTFTTPGIHHVCVAVYNGNPSDPNTSAFDRSGDIQVTEVDPGPTAKLVLSATQATTGQSITFDASGSTSAVPGGLTYHFDVDGDTSNGYEVDNGTNPVVAHVYANNFNQAVGVQVTDRDGKSSSASVQLTVSTPPVLGPQGVPVDANGKVLLPPSISDGPLGVVTFTYDKTTIQQFLTSGMQVHFQWGAVNAKAAVSYSLVTSKKVKGKTKKTKLLIAAPKDTVFYSPGSGFSREAKGKAATALRKLKKATIELDWTVTSKQGDKKTGTVTVVIPQGQR
ncbi:MAG: PKD domain-containing protein [Solirubrobacteraceae bacterium]|nr:PKD domain-containing protein [Patulibacter sp.]